VTLPAGVVIPPTQPAAPAMPTPTVLPPTMPAASAPPHDMSYQPSAPAAQPPVAPPPTQMQPAGAPVLNDPSLPPELQGKTQAEMIDYYNKLRNYYISNQPTSSPAPAPVVAAPSPAPQPPVSAADFWADPVSAIQQVVAATMAPVTQTAVQQQVIAARNSVAAQAPGYGELEGRVLEKLQGIPAEQLANPELWKQAYYLAYGEASVSGWRPSAAAQPTAPASAPAPAPALAQPTVNTQPRPFAPTQFFTEPARPNAGPAAALTPEQQQMAAKLSMSHEDYTKWMPGGVR